MRRKKSQKVIALVLSMLMVFSMMPASVFAGVKEAPQARATNKQIYISVERYDAENGAFMWEKVPMKMTVNENNIKTIVTIDLKNALGLEKIRFSTPWPEKKDETGKKYYNYPEQINGLDEKEGYIWFISVNGEHGLELSDFGADDITGEEIPVVRLIYAKSDGSQIGAEDSSTIIPKRSKLKISKDELVKNIVDATNSKYATQGKAIIDVAKECLLNPSATAEEVNKNVVALKTVLDGSFAKEVSAVEIQNKDLNVNIGKTLQMKAAIKPEGALGSVNWSVDNKNAKIDSETGILTGLAEGTVNVTAKVISKGKEFSDVAEVKVNRVAAKSVTINEKKVSVEEGKTTKLTATLTPAEATDKVIWTSKKPEKATVDAKTGVVTGISKGTAVIEAKAGDKTATIEIEVTETTKPYVYFEHEDGRIQRIEGDTFKLSLIDEGTFKVANGTVIEDIGWECSEEFTDDEGSSTRYIIKQNGKYDPYFVKKRQAHVAVFDKDGDIVDLNFNLETTPSEIEEIKVKVNGEVYSPDKAFHVDGASTAWMSVEGRKKGTKNYINIPLTALQFKSTDIGSVDANRQHDGKLVLKQGSAVITVSMEEENSPSTHFTAVVGDVHVEDMNVNVPTVYEIDNWNHLGGYYVGIMPHTGFQIQFKPSNVTNKAVKWEALTPEIATYMEAFDNGIIPKKNGTAKFRVTSLDNPNVSKIVVIEFKYKKPVTNIVMQQKKYTVDEGNTFRLNPKFTPSDATEQRFNWTFKSNDGGQIKIKTDVTGDIGYKNFAYEVMGVKAGTVNVVGTPFDTTNNVEPIEFTVKVNKASQQLSKVVGLEESIKHGLDNLNIAGNVKYGEEWGIITLARTGRVFTEREKSQYVKSLEEATANGKKLTVINTERVVMALTALGLDPRTVCKNTDFIADIYNTKGLATNHKNFTSNMLIWALTAYDAHNYEIPADSENTRDALIKGLLDYQMENGGFNLYIGKDALLTDPMMDITGMALQALAKYQDRPEVKKAIDAGLSYMSERITGNAGFINEGGENSCTSAQVILALTKLNINLCDPSNGFVRNNKNIVSRLQEFEVENGYSLIPNKPADGTSTLQATYGLEAYRRYVKGENPFYDMNDVELATEKPVAPEVKPETDETTGDVIIKDLTSVEVGFNPAIIENASNNIIVELSGSKIVYDKKAVEAIKKQLPKDAVEVKVEVKQTNRYSENLTDAQNSALKKNKNGKLYKVTLTAVRADGSTFEIKDFRPGTVTITLDFANPGNKKLDVVRVEKDGTFTRVKSSYADGKLTWITSGHSYYMVSEAGTIKGTINDEVLFNGSNGNGKAPKTNDNANVLGWMLIMMAAVAAAPVVRRKFDK